ncbi:MAG: choice-of-anchor J domain-containing protein [Thermoanaerobaculaceae bacterium]
MIDAKRMAATAWMAAVTAVALGGTVLAESGPVKVGEHYAVQLQTPHPAPLAPAGEPAWLETVHHPGASYVAVHFAELRLAPGERVVVRTPDARFSYTFAGEGKPGTNGRFWATHVPGDTCEVLLLGGGDRAGWGFRIDEYAAGYPIPSVPDPQAPSSICGDDDSEWARCYLATEPMIYERSRAVARLLINGSGACTGWLVGTEGHLITNNHCISTTSAASNTDFELMAEGAACDTSCASWFACPGTVVASEATLVKTDAPRDYTLLKLPVNPTPTYGYLQLRQAGAALGERIYVAGHPAGWGKRLSVHSTAPQDPTGEAQVTSLAEPACQTGGPPDVGYYADTQGGSSGSPVLAYADHKVVALHHCGTCPNRGVPIQDVISHLGTSIPPGAIEDAPALGLTSSSSADACAAGGPGHADGNLDPGETVSLTLRVTNSGNVVASDVTATLSSSSPHVAFIDATAAFADLEPGSSGSNLDALVFTLAPDTPCGTAFAIGVALTSGGRTWSAALSFRAGLVNAETTLVLNEGFEEAAFPPAGWNRYRTGDQGSQGFQQGQTGSPGTHASPHTGTYYAWHDDEQLTTTAVDWLVLPQVTIPAAGGVLKLWERDYYGSYHEYHGVWVTTGSSPDPGVSSYVELQRLVAPGATWKQTSVDLSAHAGQTVFVALRYTGDYKDEWYVDDLELWESSCTTTACNPAGQRFLAVVKAGDGVGTVTSDPPGIACGSTCGAFFPEGEEVELTAANEPGSTFGGWSGACTGTGTCTVTMSQAASVTATFTLEQHLLAVDKDGSGTGVVTSAPTGIDCGSRCASTFDHGTIVTLTPSADASSTFVGWSGDCRGTEPCQLTMDTARAATATFTLRQHVLTVVLAGAGAGSVVSDPTGIDCGVTCAHAFDHGVTVTLTPAAGADSEFLGWSGACTGTGACAFAIDQPRTVTATFGRLPKVLSVATAGTGAGTVTSTPSGIACGSTCAAAFAHGQSVELTAAAAPGSVFAGWSGDCSGTSGCTVLMDQPRAVTATFTLLPALTKVGPAADLAASATSDGNFVLEPGEQALFSPMWHNPGSREKTTSGVASGLVGPAGATYTLADTAADYGTLAPGASVHPHAATGNAYAIGVSLPVSRPGMHWDVQITETLLTGERHTWTLHIGNSFLDVPRSHWAYGFVERLLHGGVTTGCPGDRTYCPDQQVPREQMAAFLARGLAGGDANVPAAGTIPGVGDYDCGPGGQSRFSDVPVEAWYCPPRASHLGCGGDHRLRPGAPPVLPRGPRQARPDGGCSWRGPWQVATLRCRQRTPTPARGARTTAPSPEAPASPTSTTRTGPAATFTTSGHSARSAGAIPGRGCTARLRRCGVTRWRSSSPTASASGSASSQVR